MINDSTSFGHTPSIFFIRTDIVSSPRSNAIIVMDLHCLYVSIKQIYD